MTIEKIFDTANMLFNITDRNDFTGKLINLKNSLSNFLNVSRANTGVETYRKMLETNKTEVLSNMLSVDHQLKEELGEITYLEFNLEYVTGLQGKLLLDALSSAIDRKDLEMIERIENNLSPFYNLYSFHNSTNQLGKDYNLAQNIIEQDSIAIIFQNGTLITKLNELSKASSEWVQVINCFARLVGENDTNIEVISVKRECLILTVTAISTIIIAIAKCSKIVQDVILKGLEIKQKKIELEKMELSKLSDVIDLMEKASKLNIENETEQISKELLNDYEVDEASELYHEIKNAVNTGVRKMLNFNNDGGKVEAKLIQPNQAEKDLSEEVKKLNYQVQNHQTAIAALKNSKSILLIDENNDSDIKNDSI